MSGILQISILNGPIIIIANALYIILFGYLLIRRVRHNASSHRPILIWLLYAGAAMVLAAMLAMSILYMIENILIVFDAPLPNRARAWIIVTFASIGLATLNFWNSNKWRKVIAGVAIVIFLITAALGINAAYALNPTLGTLLGMNTVQQITPAPNLKSTAADPTGPLYKIWHPPKDIPTAGRLGSVIIPNSISAFQARPALLYLPPAALTADPPALPIMIMMMGQPGGPEQAQILIPLLDKFASTHQGLAPIMLTIDQIGASSLNPLCIDSRVGNVHSFVMDDVVKYARSSLKTLKEREYWAVGGYSNGGECAFSFGAKHPDVFGAILSICGESEPSLGSPKKTLSKGFSGDMVRYETEKPINIVSKNHYNDTVAIFTAGQTDQRYSADAQQAAFATTAAGMTTHLLIQPGGDHGGGTIMYSFENGLNLLASRFGLEKPAHQ